MDIDKSLSLAGTQLSIIEALRHVIDGEFLPSVAVEYDGATAFDLVTATEDIHPTVYVQNDDKFLYVAFDEATPNGFVAFNVYKAGAHSPNQVDAPVIDSYAHRQMLDVLTDPGEDGTFESASRKEDDRHFEARMATVTEFKIPLANLGVEPGDTIGMMFVFVEGGVAFIYPSNGSPTDPTTYVDFILAE